MKFVIVCNYNGKYVTPRGRYTKFVQSAKVYPSREAAAADACGHEQVISVDEVILG